MRPCCWHRTIGLLDWTVCGAVIVKRSEQFTGLKAAGATVAQEAAHCQR